MDGDRRVEGTIAAQLPSGLYRVTIGSGHVTAHAAASPDRNFVRLVIGDEVEVELAARDYTRGRIIRKL